MNEKYQEEAPPYQAYAPTVQSQDQTLYDGHAPSSRGPPMDEISSPHSAYPAQPNAAPATMEYVPAPRMVTPLNRLAGKEPQDIDCPNCKRATQTRVQPEHSNMTYIKGVALGFFCCLCLACLPCCLDWDQDLNYYCGSCNKQLAHKPYNGPVSVLSTPEEALVPTQYGQDSVMHQPAATHAKDERRETAMDVFTPYKGPA
ncbi:hypothetical protein LTR49_019225 [Elasticomyces elasticus]|nr:hypothetical protein LTR49_019225 [Elasticomyces elasticus]KAK5751390.1 hypothetical protein LTS12_018548 [Elasticomyces elasticus]